MNYEWMKNISMLTDKGWVKYILQIHLILPNVKRFIKYWHV